MKKTLLITACLLTWAGVSQAQQTNRPLRTSNYYYGVTAGVNIANMAKNDGGEVLARMNGGFFGGYRFSDLFSLQAELLYSCSGTSMRFDKIDGKEVNDVAHLNMNYLNVPVLAKFYPKGGFNIYAGVQVGFLISQKFNYHNDKTRVYLNAHKVDYAIPIGIGYDFEHLMIGVRYQQGLVDIFKNSANKDNNTVLSVNVGYKF